MNEAQKSIYQKQAQNLTEHATPVMVKELYRKVGIDELMSIQDVLTFLNEIEMYDLFFMTARFLHSLTSVKLPVSLNCLFEKEEAAAAFADAFLQEYDAALWEICDEDFGITLRRVEELMNGE